MKQKGLFDEEVRASDGDEFAPMKSKLTNSQDGSVDVKVLVLVGLLLVVGGYAVYEFLLKKEEPTAPSPMPVKKMPIKGAPTVANVPGAAKETAKVDEKKEIKAEAVKPSEVKVGKNEEAAKPKLEIKTDKPAPKEAAKAEIKKPEVKPEIKAEVKKPVEAKIEAETKKTSEVKVSQKEAAKAEEKAPKISKERHDVVVGTYAAKYAAEEAQEKLKGKGIKSSFTEVKKKLLMSRIFIKEVKGKEEVRELLSELKGKGYDPFSVIDRGNYKVYAVSNMNEDIADENKTDLEKLGYQPVIEKRTVTAKVYELVVRSKSAKEAKTLSAKLKKMGFRPETRN